MVRIAVASIGSKIANVFASAEGFRIYEFDGTTIHVVDYFDKEDLNMEALPELFKGLGVTVLFSGNIEYDVFQSFKEQDIQVVSNLRGNIADTIVGHYLDEILENKKRGLKPLSSCHSTNGSDH